MNKLTVLLLSLILLLAACGEEAVVDQPAEQEETPTENATETDSSDVEEPAEEVEAPPAEEKTEDENKTEARQAAEASGEWEETDFGKIKVVGVGYNDEVGIDGTDAPLKPVALGPINMEISGLAVLDIQPSQDAKDLYFEGKEKVRAIIIDTKVENTEESDVSFDPIGSVIVTNTGEQVDPDMFLTSDIGGDFLGKVKKEGQIWWILNDAEAEITSVKLVIPSPYSTEAWEDLAEEKRLEFEVLNYEESLERDQP